MTGSHKVLIVQGCATVAEGRQGGQEVTLRNNNANEPILKVVSASVLSVTRFAAHQGSRKRRYLRLSDVVHLRHYIGAAVSLIIRHCERVNGKPTAMPRKLPGTKGESYVQAIATKRTWNCCKADQDGRVVDREYSDRRVQ